MSDTSGHHRSRWRLTLWGWILTMAVPVLVVLAIVDPSPGVIIGLIVVIFGWAGRLASSFLQAGRAGPTAATLSRQTLAASPPSDTSANAATVID